MKLNWFSPLPPASTDIAHYTARVLPALCARATVTLWTDRDGWDTSLESYAEVRRYTLERPPWAELNRAEVSVYHLGNNPLFHGSIWQLAHLSPGVVVLHDLRLHHFFDGLYRVKWRDLDGYLAVMEKFYGEQGRQDALDCYRHEARNIDRMAELYPLTRLATENALGVLVHSREGFEHLKREHDGPLAYAPLPYPSRPGPEIGPAKAGPPFSVVVFGYLGRNRRLDALLTALSESEQREQFRLDIYGQVLDDNKNLRARIRELGLKRQVTLHGFVPEAELDQALGGAHLAVNLRYPTMGEASGSQLRIWSHALPSLVTDVGWYAKLPSETVLRVRPEHEVSDIKTHLEAFLRAPAEFAQMGQRGRDLLEQEHSPETYAQAVVDFARVARRDAPRAAARKLALRAGALMSDWTSEKSNGEQFQRVAAEILALTKR